MRRIGDDVRRQRLALGLSQRRLAQLVGLSHAAVGRIERGEVPVDVLIGSRICSMLGMELSVGCHLIGSPARDKAHLALLERFHGRLPPSLVWRTEEPLPIPGDLRALDAVVRGGGFGALVEAETHLTDVQATLRKIHAKQRDAGLTRAILLLNDTRHNRAMVASSPELRRAFSLTTRQVLSALAKGRDPGADGIVLI